MVYTKPESWAWYGVCAASVVARTISRSLLVKSWWRLPLEDWLMFFTFIVYTGFIVTLNKAQDTWEKFPEIDYDFSTVPESAYPEVIVANKYTLVMEILQNASVWLVKACMIALYFRLMNRLWQHRVVIALAIYTAVTFVIMFICFLTVWCQPLEEYWDVIQENSECNTFRKHLIMNLSFNLSADVVFLIILVPLIIQLQLQFKQKIIVYCLVGLGVFSVISTVLCRAVVLANPIDIQWPLWYIREPSTGILCANLPLLGPLAKRAGGFFSSTISSLRSGSRGSRLEGTGGSRSRPSEVMLDSLQKPGKRAAASQYEILQETSVTITRSQDEEYGRAV